MEVSHVTTFGNKDRHNVQELGLFLRIWQQTSIHAKYGTNGIQTNNPIQNYFGEPVKSLELLLGERLTEISLKHLSHGE